MTIKPLKVAAAVVALGALGSAHAASVSISPDFTVAAVGDTVSFQISADFSDVPGDLVAGGSININYGDGLGFVGVEIEQPLWDPAFSFALGDETDGDADYVFGTFSGASTDAPFNLLTITFEVLGNANITMSTSSAPGSSGWLTFSGGSVDPDYGSAEVVVPLPAAVWFMLSGLGALIGFGRKRA